MSANAPDRLIVTPAAPLRGSLRIPGDKSISHRALILAAIADGETSIDGILNSADIAATRAAFAAMGVEIESIGDSALHVHGVGRHGLQAPAQPLDLGNSGTSARLLAGLLAGQSFDTELRGDDSLTRRPMRRVAAPLAQMGARIQCSGAETLPMQIRGGASLAGIDYEMPVASAQVKSALLLAGLYAKGRTCITEPAPTRDHTERMLAFFGCPVERNGKRVCVEAKALTGCALNVPGDISSAAFFMVAATITPGSAVTLMNVGINPTRHAVIGILRAMGANIEMRNSSEQCGEPVADITVRHAPLHGIAISESQVAIAIDEMPALMIAAAFAQGTTRLRGAAELRVKESDRIAAMQAGFVAVGVDSVALDDGMDVTGGGFDGGTVQSCGDHRIAMAFAVAGSAARTAVTVNDCVNIETSFPGFARALSELGGAIQGPA